MNSKGAHSLIEALIILNKQGIKIQATLAGTAFQSNYKEHLIKRLKDNNLDDAIVFTGNLDRPQLARMYRLHQIGIFPSIHPEAFGIVGAEMQLSGLALITSGVGGAGELITDGQTGLCFEPNNPQDLAKQIKLLAKNPALLRRIAKAGQQQAKQQFTVMASCRQLVKLMQSEEPIPN